ncbi:hypothetical protein [Lactobacillus acidophilus]|uniref:hypothetical protein n=1 Tax=Lactobacillus acidophilus TaxID=1579 RepID=UPI0021A4B168|nr:hypothetical protein [Lactobacillus acidophilus]
MTEKQHYDFMSAISDQITNPFLPIKIATTDQIESFSPPIFAAYCSRNGNVFIKRLAQYKPLIGPLIFKLNENDQNLSITLTTGNDEYILPNFVVLSEFAFLVGMMRKITKEKISPVQITCVSLTLMIKSKLSLIALLFQVKQTQLLFLNRI